jgi:hypothetical protein
LRRLFPPIHPLYCLLTRFQTSRSSTDGLPLYTIPGIAPLCHAGPLTPATVKILVTGALALACHASSCMQLGSPSICRCHLRYPGVALRCTASRELDTLLARRSLRVELCALFHHRVACIFSLGRYMLATHPPSRPTPLLPFPTPANYSSLPPWVALGAPPGRVLAAWAYKPKPPA